MKLSKPTSVALLSLTVSLTGQNLFASDIEPDIIPDPGNQYRPAVTDVQNTNFPKKDVVGSRKLTPREIEKLNQLPESVSNTQFGVLNSGQDLADRSNIDEINDQIRSNGTARILITFVAPLDSKLDEGERLEIDQSIDLAFSSGASNVIKRYDNLPVYLVEVDQQGMAELQALSGIAAVELDKPEQRDHQSTTPIIHSDLLNEHSTDGEGWNGGNGGWDVAIADDGTRTTHVAFAGRIASEACFNKDGSCPNGSTVQIGAGSACGAVGGCPHGTHVSGTAMGDFTTSGLLTKDGVAPGSKLHIVDVFTSAGAWVSDQVAAMDYISSLVANGERIASINFSLGGGSHTGACDYASASRVAAAGVLRNQGVLVVAAAGNSYSTNSMGTPACLTPYFSVAATDDADTAAYFTSISAVTDVWAPGVSVTSAGHGSDTQLLTYQGTSMSAPHVAGSAALLRECYHTPGGPTLSPGIDDAVAAAMVNTGPLIADNRSGGIHVLPRLDLLNAVNYIRPHNQFSAATTLPPVLTSSMMGMNACATNEANEPFHNPSGFETTASVWYKYTVPMTAAYEFSTCDAVTSFDTVLALYRGSNLSSLNLVASNDDSAPSLCSTVTGNLVAGETVHLAVSGYGVPDGNGNTGLFNLSWNKVGQNATCNGLPATIVGTVNGETLVGTPGPDVIVASDGNDTVFGLGGNDVICLGDGDDIAYGHSGSDVIKGGNGIDTIYGNSGSDRLYGEDGDDELAGGDLNDLIYGGRGLDYITGDYGDDRLFGQQEADDIFGGDGDDKLYGGQNNDDLWGGPGDDRMWGETGHDRLYGESGNDSWLDGGDHNDKIYGGSGNDVIRGGDHRDSVYGQGGNDDVRAQAGNDLVTDGGTGIDSCQVAPGLDVPAVNCE